MWTNCSPNQETKCMSGLAVTGNANLPIGWIAAGPFSSPWCKLCSHLKSESGKSVFCFRMLREESYSMMIRASAENMLSSPHFEDDDMMQSRTSSRASDGQNSNYGAKGTGTDSITFTGQNLEAAISESTPLSGTSFDYGSVVDGTGRRLTTTPTHNFEENGSDGRRSFSNNGSDAMPGLYQKSYEYMQGFSFASCLGKAAPSAVFQGMRQWSSQNPLLSKSVGLLQLH